MQALADRFLPMLLKASWQAAVIVMLVLLAQWLLGMKLPPRWRCALWLLVVVRLALPWTMPSSVSLFNLFHSSPNPPANATVISQGWPQTNPTILAPPAFAPNWSLALPCLWAVGAAALIVYLIAGHFRLWRRVTPCRPLIDPQILNLLEDCKELMGARAPVALVETAAVDGPSLFGWVRPRLLLPPGFTGGFSKEELRHVFLHELAHVKRNDIPLGWLMALLQAVHWFNPLVWLAFSRLRMERELACDALALSRAGAQENKPYGRTIVKLLEHFGDSVRAPGLAGMVEEKQQMKERIRMIALFQNTNHGAALAGALIVGLGLLTLTDCKTADNLHAAIPTDASMPPRIVSTSPAVGASDVNPATKEITVSFNQDMQAGFSWTGGGADFPPAPEGAKAHWRNKRTCVLPVTLEAGHYYRVGINSSSYQNFRSVAGVSALPAAIYFTAKGAGEEQRAKVLAPRVVRCEPPNRAQNVSPATAELRITFNVPMGAGFSWCAAGDNEQDFPKSLAGIGARWTGDKKTCVLPVKLARGMTYRISLNAPEFKNFQSEAGVPLEPTAYSFTTAGTAEASNNPKTSR